MMERHHGGYIVNVICAYFYSISEFRRAVQASHAAPESGRVAMNLFIDVEMSLHLM